MVSDTPRENRCGARVTDKVGLELQLESESELESDESPPTITDEHITIVRLTSPNDGAYVDAVPNYEDVREYLWNDYEPVAVAIGPEDSNADDIIDTSTVSASPGDSTHAHTPPDDTVGGVPAHDDEDLSWLVVAGDVKKTTNARKSHQGYCERYMMNDSDWCYVHQPGPGAPDPVGNAIQHGLHAQRTNFYNYLDDENQRFVEALVDSWLSQSQYERDNVAVVNELYRCAIDQVRAWHGIDELVENGEIEGLVKEQEMYDSESGEFKEIEDEHPVNLPYSRLDRDIQSKLKTLGIYDDPDSQQADATESLAQALSGLADE